MLAFNSHFFNNLIKQWYALFNSLQFALYLIRSKKIIPIPKNR